MPFPAAFRRLVAHVRVRVVQRYHPERHYMRGPGPAYAARLARMSGGAIV